MKTWRASAEVGGVHVIPLEDIVEHTKSEACFCGPSVLVQGVPNMRVHFVRRVVTHEAMDGRE